MKLCLHLSYIEQNSFHFNEIFHRKFGKFQFQVQQQREVGINNESSPVQDLDQDGSSGFVKPRSSEKKDKKAKKAEEKKRAREKEAKRNAGQAGNDYIPGMEGSVRPSNDSENEENTQQRQYVGPFRSFTFFSPR